MNFLLSLFCEACIAACTTSAMCVIVGFAAEVLLLT